VYLLGLDVGTTGCKSVIFNEKGDVVSSAYGEYTLYHRRPEWSELNPDEVWTTVMETIRASVKNGKVNPELIIALSTSVLGDAFIPVDKNGNPVYWSMTTFDARATEQTRWWEENFGADEMFRITGQPLTFTMPIYPLPKIQWLQENEPEVYRKTAMFLCWEDYLNMKLCGKPVTDFSVASRTMMFDITKKEWSKKILDTANFDEALFPEIKPAGEAIGYINRETAKKTGLSPETLVVTGGHDQPCGALGAGIIKTGPVMDATGTVECIGVLLKELLLTPKIRLQGFAVHHYVIENEYFMFGFNPTSGVILRWFRDNFALQEKEEAKRMNIDVYDLLTSMAAKSPIGAKELFLLPYFEGSGTPNFNRQIRGAFLGLTLAHDKKDVLRAILEGLSYELRNNVDAMETHGTKITELRTIGGGAKSEFWLQLKADVTGRKVVVPNITEAAATGAAILASVGAGVYRDTGEAVKAIYREKATFTPNPENNAVYEKYYGVYRQLYEPFSSLFKNIAELSHE